MYKKIKRRKQCIHRKERSMSIQLFRQTNLFREDIDAWRQGLIQNRGSITGYLITMKYSHTIRQVTDMQINKRKAIDDRVRDEQRIFLSTDL